VIDHPARKGSWLASLLLVSIGVVSCAPATASVSATPTTRVIPASVVPTLAAEPTVTRPAPSPTTPAAATATVSAVTPVTPATLGCEAAEQWSQTQDDLTLSLCFAPYPPQLGILTTYEAVLVNSAGLPLLEAVVELTMVGGVDMMEGEYDEDFPVMLVSQGVGRYTAQARVGSTGLVLEQLRLEVRHGQKLWSFSVSAEELLPP